MSSNGGKILISEVYFKNKKTVNTVKLEKEITKLTKILSNKHYVDNNSNAFITAQHKILTKKKLELLGHKD